METTITSITSPITVVLGDLHGWHPRLVYRSTAPVPVSFSADGRFLTVTVRGEQRVGPVVTPEDYPQPVVYLGGELPRDPWTESEGWHPADMPQGVVSDVVETDVLALVWVDGGLTGYAKSVWLDRAFRPMERFTLPVSGPLQPTPGVACRVLEAGLDPFQDGNGMRMLVVTVDDPQPLAQHGWHPQHWLAVGQQAWADLRAVSECIESVSYPLLGDAILASVEVHDLTALDPESLILLPQDVRVCLEITLRTMPD